jgi:hypothetical protein
MFIVALFIIAKFRKTKTKTKSLVTVGWINKL